VCKEFYYFTDFYTQWDTGVPVVSKELTKSKQKRLDKNFMFSSYYGYHLMKIFVIKKKLAFIELGVSSSLFEVI